MPETTRAAADRGGQALRRRGVRVGPARVRRAADRRRSARSPTSARTGRRSCIPGSIAPEMDRELQAWTRRVQNFAREAYSRVAAQAARAARGQGGDRRAALARRPRRGGGRGGRPRGRARPRRRPASTRTGAARCSRSGRRCGSTRAPGIVALLRDRELDGGDLRRRRHHGPRRVPRAGRAVELGSLERALRVGVRSGRDARRSSRRRPT